MAKYHWPWVVVLGGPLCHYVIFETCDLLELQWRARIRSLGIVLNRNLPYLRYPWTPAFGRCPSEEHSSLDGPLIGSLNIYKVPLHIGIRMAESHQSVRKRGIGSLVISLA